MADQLSSSKTPRIIAGVALLAAGALLVFPAPEGIDGRAMRGAARTIFAIGLYATRIIPEFLTAFAYFLAAMLFAVAPASVVFSGFQSTAFWLVFSGLIIGVGVRRSGLADYLARGITDRFTRSYATLVTGVVVLAVTMAFLLPSTMSRVVIMTPIVSALADRVGFGEGSNGRVGLILAMAAAGILPSHVPNLVMVGAAETLYDVSFTYGTYFFLHFPVLGVLKSACIVLLVLVMFPDKLRSVTEETTRAPLSPEARRMVIILMVTLALWITDFLHGISPAWVSLGTGIFCLLPGVGLIPPSSFNKDMNFATVFYVAGIISIGPMLVDTGMGEVLGRYILGVLPIEPGADFGNYLSLTGLSIITGIAATTPTVPAVITPLAADMAAAADMPLFTVLMTQVVGYSTIVFPYQVPPVIIACQLGGVSIKAAARLALAIAAITIFVLVPLNYLWWDLLGYFG